MKKIGLQKPAFLIYVAIFFLNNYSSKIEFKGQTKRIQIYEKS
jgi:hypothetical protein